MILIWQVLAGMCKAWLLKKKRKSTVSKEGLWISHMALPWEKASDYHICCKSKNLPFTNCFNIRLTQQDIQRGQGTQVARCHVWILSRANHSMNQTRCLGRILEKHQNHYTQHRRYYLIWIIYYGERRSDLHLVICWNPQSWLITLNKQLIAFYQLTQICFWS